MHYWVRASSGDFAGSLPPPRSGHTAVGIGSSKVVFFGGFIDKKFLNDIFVLDVENNLWFQPECTGSGSDGQVGPSPRAFHVAVSIDCHMFIFGGRSGGKRLGDFWVLDTDIWQWSELTSFGDLPSARDFAGASAIGNQKIVMYGGWDGKKWLSDVYILDTISLEWTELSAIGSLPPPRCGHTATMVEKRLLVYGGRGGGGPIMGDLWALKGLIEGVSISTELLGAVLATQLIINRSIDVSIDDIWIIDHFHFFHNVDISCNGSTSETKSDQSRVLSATVDLNEENETPGWTQLKLPGQAPSPRCGHTVTSGGVYLLMFGGHGTGGWLSRYDIYFNDCIILDRVSAQWKRLPTTNDAPPARAYHSMTCIGSRHLLFGGFDGKVTFGDLWWLVPEGDPIAKRPPNSPPRDPATTAMTENIEEPRREESAISELRKRLNITVPLSSSGRHIVDESEDKEFCDLALMFSGENVANDTKEAIIALRDHWKTVEPKSILLKELGPLLGDYQRLITRQIDDAGSNPQSIESGLLKKESSRYYHLRNATQLKMDDVSKLLAEYRQLLSHEKQTRESTVMADVHEKR